MNNILTLANAFLTIESMSHKKLQKLCYYAKAWYLALYDENIIEENFQAWVHGPVNPKLYSEFKDHGFHKIPQVNHSDSIPEEYMSFAKEVFEAYGELTGDDLEALSHSEDPWISARKDLKPWERCNTTINENDMKQYYRRQIEA